MSFLTKGMVIRRRDILIVTAFPALFVSFTGSWYAVVLFLYYQRVTIPMPLVFTSLLPMISFAFAVFFGGFFVDRVKMRRPFFLLCFAWTASAFLPLIFKTAVIIPISMIASGAFMGSVLPAAYSFLADQTEVYERGRVGGIARSAAGLLYIIFVLAGSWSLDLWFALVGAGAFVMGLVGLVLPEKRISPKEEWRSVPTRSVFEDRNFLLFLGLAIVLGFFWSSNTVLVANYAEGILPNPRFTFQLVISTIYFISGFFSGFLVDRLGRRPIIIIGALFIASGFMPFVFLRAFWTFFLTAVFFAIGFFFTFIAVSLVIPGDLARKEARGRYYGTVLTGIVGGSMLGSEVGHLLLTSSPTVIITLNVFVAFLIILPTTVARETLPPKEQIKEMYDYIKEIEDEKSKDKDEPPN